METLLNWQLKCILLQWSIYKPACKPHVCFSVGMYTRILAFTMWKKTLMSVLRKLRKSFEILVLLHVAMH